MNELANSGLEAGLSQYTSPEPMLQTPEFVRSETGQGFTTPVYAYARNNPLRYTDPTGLFSNDPSCKWLPVENEALDIAKKISDPCLSACVVKSVKEIHLKCGEDVDQKCKQLSAQYKGNTSAYTYAGSCSDPERKTHWCSREVSPHCASETLVHETAHAGGWHHGDGKGVPNDSGRSICK